MSHKLLQGSVEKRKKEKGERKWTHTRTQIVRSHAWSIYLTACHVFLVQMGASGYHQAFSVLVYISISIVACSTVSMYSMLSFCFSCAARSIEILTVFLICRPFMGSRANRP